MRYRIFFLVTLLLLLLCSNLFSQGADDGKYAGTYEVTLHKQNPFLVSVRARIKTTNDSINIHPSCPSYKYTDGWASFIKNLKQKNGEMPAFIGRARWALSEKGKKEIAINYDVDLSFVNETWEAGNEQAGIFIDSALFVVSRVLFIHGNVEGKYLVKFTVPTGWSLTAPWQKDAQSSTTYEVTTLDKLINNTLVWGKPVIKLIQSGNFSLNVALLGDTKNQSELILDVFKKTLKAYQGIFKYNEPVNYLVTLFYAAQQDGEAYASGNAFTIKNKIASTNKIMWANQLAHELFHFWNGRTIQPKIRNEMQWFNEGFTEYYTNLILLKTGVISEKEYWSKQEKQFGLYAYFRLVQYPEISLKEASARKSLYRFGVYNGGVIAAFVLDMMIQEKTHGTKTLDDAMYYMMANFGAKGIQFQLKDFIETVYLVSGLDTKIFFEKYIAGKELFPFDEYLNKIGLKVEFVPYEAEAFISTLNLDAPLSKFWKLRIKNHQ